MRTRITALATVALAVLVACTDMAPLPTAPSESEAVEDGPLHGADAVRQVIADLKSELTDPVAAAWGARLHDQTVEERASDVKELIALLEQRLAGGVDMMAAAFCDADAVITNKATTIVVTGPDPPDNTPWVRVNSFVAASGRAWLSNDLMVIQGYEWEWHGAPPVGQEQTNMSDTTDCCTTAFYKPRMEFRPRYLPGFVWGFSIHRLLDNDGELVEKKVSEAVAFLDRRGNPVDDPGIGR